MNETEDIVRQWIERADYDLGAAESMRQSGHFLYVAFLCQQAAEKSLKALWCNKRSDSPPFTHNLAVLAETLLLNLEESRLTLLDRLKSYYIVGRYPTFKQKLSGALNFESASELLKETGDFVAWCKRSITK